jgi:TonB-dependent receptor
MKTAFRFLALFLTFGLAAIHAQAPSGTIIGHVTDANSKLALAGVRVAVSGTSVEGFSDQQGDYRLSDVPAGAQTLTFSYVGYAVKALPVGVAAGQTVRLDAVFGDEVVKLGEFVITGEAVGTARAINEERGADSLTNIVAADAVGLLPDKNIAEALERVPGVDLYRDKGEGRFVEIRGIDPVYIGVSFNGIRASTTEKDTREVTLDPISSDMISGLEVNKVATPELDGDAVGGSVNVKTRSGFDQEGMQAMVSAGTNFSDQEDRHGGYNGAAYYGNQYLNGKLGVFIGVTGEYRPFTVYNSEEIDPWELVTSPTDGQNHWLFGGQDFRHYDVNRFRHGLDASLDYKFDDTSSVFFRYTMSYYTERDNYWVTEVPFQSASSILALNDTSGSAVIPAKSLLKEGAGVVNSKISTSLVGGFDKTFGPFTNNFETGYTIGKYTRPTVIVAFANTSAMTMNYAFSDPWNDAYSQSAGPSFNDPSQYAFSTKSSFTNTQAGMHEETVKDDLRDDLNLNGVPAYIKAGVEYRNKNAYEAASKGSITAAPYTFAAEASPDTQYQWGGFQSPRLSTWAIEDYYASPTSFAYTQSASNISANATGSYMTLEDVGAVYIEGGATFGKLKIVAGARVENTHFWIAGTQYETSATATTYAPVAYDHNYANFLPDIILTYNLDPRTVARASWTNTLARPDFGDTNPGRTVDDVNHLVTQGNPKIDALNSMNWDASIEHYSASLGAVEAALFYKSINNFPYQAQSGIDPSTGYLLTTYYTAPSAWIYGLELSARQRFGFLPAPFDGLGVSANATFGDSHATYPTRPGEDLPFIGYAKIIANFALTYEKNGLKLDIAVNHHSPRMEVDSALGGNLSYTGPSVTVSGKTITAANQPVTPAYTQDIYEDAFTEVDFGSSYTFLQHWQVYLNGSNLTNAPLREYFGGTAFKRLSQYEKYGPGFETGLRWTY